MQSQSSCIKLLRGFHCLVSPEDLDAASTQCDTEHSAWLLYSVLTKMPCAQMACHTLHDKTTTATHLQCCDSIQNAVL